MTLNLSHFVETEEELSRDKTRYPPPANLITPFSGMCYFIAKAALTTRDRETIRALNDTRERSFSPFQYCFANSNVPFHCPKRFRDFDTYRI